MKKVEILFIYCCVAKLAKASIEVYVYKVYIVNIMSLVGFYSDKISISQICLNLCLHWQSAIAKRQGTEVWLLPNLLTNDCSCLKAKGSFTQVKFAAESPQLPLCNVTTNCSYL